MKMRIKYHFEPHRQLEEVERMAHSTDIFDKFGGMNLTFEEVQDLWADVCWEIEQAFQRGLSTAKKGKI